MCLLGHNMVMNELSIFFKVRLRTFFYITLPVILSIYKMEHQHELLLTLVLLNQDILSLENSLDTDQLDSDKPSDQDLHCFPVMVQPQNPPY